MPPKPKSAVCTIDWKATREPQDIPQFLKEIGEKVEKDVKLKTAFPKRHYKDCPDALRNVADTLEQESKDLSNLQEEYTKLKRSCAELERDIAVLKDPNPGPLPYHLESLLLHANEAEKQGHFRYESHVDKLVASFLTHYFPVKQQFFVGPQQTFMTGTAADSKLLAVADSWSICADHGDTTTGIDLSVPHDMLAEFSRDMDATSTPKPNKAFGEFEAGVIEEDFFVESPNLRGEAPNSIQSPPHNSLHSPATEPSFSMASLAKSATSQASPSGSGSHETSFLQPEPPRLIHFPAARLAESPTSQAVASGSGWQAISPSQTPRRASPPLQEGPPSRLQSAQAVLSPQQSSMESDVFQQEVPSLEGSMSAMERLELSFRSFLKDAPSKLEGFNLDPNGRLITNPDGRSEIKRPDFTVGILEHIHQQVFKNLIVVEDKLRLKGVAATQLLGYMEDLEKGGGNPLALGMAVVFTASLKLEVAMFRREKADGPIRNIGGTYTSVNGVEQVKLTWYPLHSPIVRDELLKIWNEEVGQNLH